jgi:DNA-binding FadR family transcriptional regulator
MNISRLHKNDLSEFLIYLAAIPESADQRIPPLTELSVQLGISVATLREQLEIARMLGVVEVKPKAGIKKLPYNFKSTLLTSLAYAVEADVLSFEKLSDYRKHLEASYFLEAAPLLTSQDIERLSGIVRTAQSKISHTPGQIPAAEHREFHLLMYKKLENPYVTGMLEAYWEIYRIAGLDVYSDLNYAERVWKYHEKIIEQIKTGNYSEALKFLLEHMELVNQRVKVQPRLSFE